MIHPKCQIQVVLIQYAEGVHWSQISCNLPRNCMYCIKVQTSLQMDTMDKYHDHNALV